MKSEICAGGFVIKKNKFLFGKRSGKKTWASKKWDIVGGRSLEGESPLETLKRETYEETGITVLNAVLLTSIEVQDKKQNEYFCYHIYMVTEWKGKASNLTKEHSSLRWFTRRKLRKIKLALKDYLPMIDNWLSGVNMLQPDNQTSVNLCKKQEQL